MNDDSYRDDSRAFSTLAGFALGAVVGAGIALLLAPTTGAETRKRVAETARRLGKDAGRTLEQARDTVRDTVSDIGSDAKSAIDAGREAFARDGRAPDTRPTPAASVPGV